jgi:hypothetical protein
LEEILDDFILEFFEIVEATEELTPFNSIFNHLQDNNQFLREKMEKVDNSFLSIFKKELKIVLSKYSFKSEKIYTLKRKEIAKNTFEIEGNFKNF